MNMNKVDLEVKRLLLGYPTLFKHRFDVLCHILACNGGGFEWRDGALVHIFDDGKSFDQLRQKGLADVEDQVRKAEERISEYPSPSDLTTSFLVQAQAELARATSVADHIDIYAKTFCGVDYRDTWRWLYHESNSGGFEYWKINQHGFKSSEEADPDWQAAIRWFLQMEVIPAANGLMGVWREKDKKFEPVHERHAKLFNHLHDLMEFWTTDANREQEEKSNKIASEIIDDILEKEKRR